MKGRIVSIDKKPLHHCYVCLLEYVACKVFAGHKYRSEWAEKLKAKQ